MLYGSMDGWAVGHGLVVAAGSFDQAAAFESILWFGGLLIVLLLSVLMVVRIRKRFRRSDSVPGIGLTLEDLRRQREGGRLTIAEYERLKTAVIEATRDGDPADSSTSPGNLFQGVGRS